VNEGRVRTVPADEFIADGRTYLEQRVRERSRDELKKDYAE